MLNIRPNINHIEANILLGNRLKAEDIKLLGLEKADLPTRIGVKNEFGGRIYFAKNIPIVLLYNEDYEQEGIYLLPELDISSGADLMCGTTIFLFLDNKEVIRMITAQLINNEYKASICWNDCSTYCTKEFGNSITVSELIEYWEDEESIVVSELSNSRLNFYVHWRLKNGE